VSQCGDGVGRSQRSEQALLLPALNNIPLELPEGIPMVADKGHDSDHGDRNRIHADHHSPLRSVSDVRLLTRDLGSIEAFDL
jgi:hypothetical protein